MLAYEQLCNACEFATQQLLTMPGCLSAFVSINDTTATANTTGNSPLCSGECRESVTNVLSVCQNQVAIYN